MGGGGGWGGGGGAEKYNCGGGGCPALRLAKYERIETHVYIRNDADVTLIRRASCRLPDFKCKVCLN